MVEQPNQSRSAGPEVWQTGAMASPAERHTERRDTSKRDAFVAAAVRVMARDGVAALTTRRIAEEAQLPQGIFHYWFASKADLLEAVLHATMVDAATATAPPGADPSDPARNWKAAFASIRDDDAGRQLGAYELTAMALRNPELRPMAQQLYQSYHEMARADVAPLVDELNASGAELDVDVTASLIAALFDGLTFAWLANPDGPPPEDVLDLAFHLLRNRIQ
jgi:AcrR family transcriptional regulator